MIAYDKRLFARAVMVCGCIVALVGAVNAQVITTNFQNGVDGYTGNVGRAISDRQVEDELDLATVSSWPLDGFNPDGSSPDRQFLLRFDNIVGTGAHQIPQGATILSAELVVSTAMTGNAQTGGPYGVAGLLQPFTTDTTSYWTDFTSATFGSRGAWYEDGYATRPVGGYGNNQQGDVGAAGNVTPLVQSWVNNPSENYGMTIQAGFSNDPTLGWNTTDGWNVNTMGHPISELRPQLNVTYTTATINPYSFQEGVNGYAGTSMAFVDSGVNVLIQDVGTPEEPNEWTFDPTDPEYFTEAAYVDGAVFSASYIDGTTSSPDQFALLKFDNVFNSVPTDVPVAKAWAVLTTGENHQDCRTAGAWSIHAMLRDWDGTTLHSEFGDINGLQVHDGDITPALDTQEGFIRGAEIWFDVTEYLEGVRNGNTDYGVVIKTTTTGDGWQIQTNASSNLEARPRLVVYSGDLGQEPILEGDFDGDNDVDGADFLVWQQELGSTLTAADLVKWQANFGMIEESGPTATAIPEPSAFLLFVAVAIAGICVRMRRSFS